jgi:catechol 2,3-dioxygenase-like lactoylglutathione lyase family enzyme
VRTSPLSLGASGNRLGPIELEAIQGQAPRSLLSEVAFSTDDVKRLRGFLLKNHTAVEKLTKCGEDPCFATLDPEHHRLVFVEKTDRVRVEIPGLYTPPWQRSPLIHAGFVVHDRAAEDRFYRDLLGFHLYWYGGIEDTGTNWVDMQVPDGTDWIEYMLNVSSDADHHTNGVMNHIAFGVLDIKAVEELLQQNHSKPGEEPKIGRDGKWQLNLYDPDETRVEFMEFTPVEKPCCSEYAGPHPGQQP